MARKYHRERLNRDSKSWRKCYGPIDDDGGGDSDGGRRRRQKRGGRRDGFSLATSVGLAREAGRQRRRPFSLRRRPVVAIASAADRPKCQRAVAAPSSERTRGETTTTTDSRTKERRAPSATSPCVVGGAALVCCRSAAGFPADTKPGPIATQRKAQGLDCALFQVEGGVVYVETGGVASTLPVLMRYCV